MRTLYNMSLGMWGLLVIVREQTKGSWPSRSRGHIRRVHTWDTLATHLITAGTLQNLNHLLAFTCLLNQDLDLIQLEALERGLAAIPGHLYFGGLERLKITAEDTYG